MATKSPNKTGPGPHSRDKRLAEALRENLKRRKRQSRQRGDTDIGDEKAAAITDGVEKRGN